MYWGNYCQFSRFDWLIEDHTQALLYRLNYWACFAFTLNKRTRQQTALGSKQSLRKSVFEEQRKCVPEYSKSHKAHQNITLKISMDIEIIIEKLKQIRQEMKKHLRNFLGFRLFFISMIECLIC